MPRCEPSGNENIYKNDQGRYAVEHQCEKTKQNGRFPVTMMSDQEAKAFYL